MAHLGFPETEEGKDEQIQSENNAHRLFQREGCGPQRQRMKTALEGRRFESIPAIQAAVTTASNEVPVEAFEGAYRAWESRWKKCVAAHGQYFEEY
jgi:hypothetical protein